MNFPNTSPINLAKGEALIPISLSYEPYNQSVAGAHRLVAINTSSGFILQQIQAVQVCKAQPYRHYGWENYTQEIDTRFKRNLTCWCEDVEGTTFYSQYRKGLCNQLSVRRNLPKFRGDSSNLLYFPESCCGERCSEQITGLRLDTAALPLKE